jgi:peptide-methionine (S)-S-oxide reductase
MKKIVLAGGCFWGVEAYYQKLKGVIETKVGYANGHKSHPSYQEVKTGTTNFVEVTEVTYDETIISLEKLMEHLFRFIDPTSLNKQGEDEGTQYRTGIYYESEADCQIAQDFIAIEQKKYNAPIVVEVKKLEHFYDAETYHQKYLDKNPTGYCHVNFGLIKPEEMK